MTDRELIELAAKAGGVDGEYQQLLTGDGIARKNQSARLWNPLTDDGDAHRLQVKLNLGLVPIEGGGWACVVWDHDDEVTLAAEAHPRRAITRGAAEMRKRS